MLGLLAAFGLAAAKGGFFHVLELMPVGDDKGGSLIGNTRHSSWSFQTPV